MRLNAREYSKEFLEQLLMDVTEIADYIYIDLEANNIDKNNCDIIAYTEFSNIYINIEKESKTFL